MPDFISKLKLDSLVNVEKQEAVSLVELLLGMQEEIYDKAKEAASTASVAGVKVKSRRSRRKSGRAAKTINRASNKKAGDVGKMEQLRVAKGRQEKRKQALLAYQLQSGQKKLIESAPTAGDAPASQRAKKKQAEKELNSIPIDPALRPVVLGLIDFKPIFDNEGQLTSAGNIVKVKRAARALAVENLFQVDTSDDLIGELDWINALLSNIAQSQAFFESLDVSSNLLMFDEALSAFEFDSTTTASASNTEVLYTLIRDYAYSMTSCSPRLLEVADRDFENETGRRLTSFPRSPNKLRFGLRIDSNPSSYLTTLLPTEDQEVALKYILAVISRELLLSYNKQANNIADPDLSRYSSQKGKADDGFGFCDWMAIKPGVSSFTPQKHSSKSEIYNLHGLVAPGPINPRITSLYAFEKSSLIGSEGLSTEFAAPYTLEQIYKSDTPTIDVGPYAGVAAAWSEATETINDILSTDTLNFNNSPGSEILEIICREVVLRCLEVLPSDGNGSASVSDALQIAFLVAAGRDDKMLRWLILYLCFLQDQQTGVAVTGEQSNLSALSIVVKGDNTLFSLINSKPPNSQTTTRYFDVPASTVSVFPPPNDPDFSNPQKTDAISVLQEVEAKQGSSSEVNSSINTFFDMSFEELCETVALQIRSGISSSTESTSSEMSDETAITLDAIKDTLMGLSTDTDSIFTHMINLLPSVKSLFGNGAFDSLQLTNYTQIPGGRIHMALIAAAAKVVYFFIDDLTSSEGRTSSVFETESGSKIITSVANINYSSMTVGPRMAMSWSSGGSDAYAKDPGGSSIKFSYSGVGAARDALSTFLDSEDQDPTTLESVSSVVSRTFAALDEEQDFSTNFISSLNDYFTNAAAAYEAVVNTVTSDINAEVEGTQTLNERIRDGLPMSSDMAKNILNYTRVFDSSDATYRDIRTRDKALISANMSFMADLLQDASFCEQDDLKYMIVGLPSGLLDKTQKVPIDMSNVDRDTTANSVRDFVISIEKVDLTRPELEYVDKEYTFSRDLFVNRIDASTEGEVVVNFDKFSEDFSVTEEIESGLSTEKFTEEQINNLKNDFALKLYSDVFLDLDFFPDAYPNGIDQKKSVLTGSVHLPFLSDVDTTMSTFLSGSNLAFDPDGRKVEGFKFYSVGDERIHIDLFKGLDPIAFSLYSYLNAYGTVASSADKKESLKFGTIFERVLAIPFDPSSFEVEIQAEDENAAEVNAQNNKIAEAEKEVSLGLETSQGVELANYRAYVTIPDAGSTELKT